MATCKAAIYHGKRRPNGFGSAGDYVLINQLIDDAAILHSALTPIIRFILRNLLSLLIIAVILAGGNFLLNEVRLLRVSNEEFQTLTDVHASVDAYRKVARSQVNTRLAHAENTPVEAIDRRIAVLRDALQRADNAPDRSLFSLVMPGTETAFDRLLDRSRRQLDLEFSRQELRYLQDLRAYFLATSGREDLRKLGALQNAAGARVIFWQNERDKLGLKTLRINVPAIYGEKLEIIQREVARAQADYQRAVAHRDATEKSLALIQKFSQRPSWSVNEQALDAVTKNITDRLAHARTAVTDNWFARYVSPVIHVLPLALVVLLSSFAGHLLVKLLFYFVLAPLAARRAPIQLEASPVKQNVRATASAVSQDIHLQPGEELLILPEFLQSSSTAAVKDTRFMLDWSCPWTSIISGMVMLTRVRTSNRLDQVVVSSDSDAVSEIALVTIPAGAAMVFQPHGMVGVIYPSAIPLKIARRWRLFSAHAWLTLQLRYLIFRGPVTLIVRGTRGVRVEPAGQGRIISQFATLGFSSHLHYATVRSETFWPYYQNKTPLLQDKFDGENGYYIYDETPRYGKRGGFFSRGLEGLTDAVLKVFGI
ncbi:MAG: hypothetical protein M3Y65_12255 [Pseudomonadota bacterium]|nr:hypothetical protein [Pseudomonadota bacterium]